MTQRVFHCRQCGHCCMNLSDAFATCATEADVRRWAAAGREDILARVEPIVLGEARVYDIWVNPKTGEDVSRCPWLRKVRSAELYVCRIHDLKPDHCRRYPRSRKHAAETGCPGYCHASGPVLRRKARPEPSLPTVPRWTRNSLTGIPEGYEAHRRSAGP
jgi:Fe-S-cluster containining protein